ncbi:MAG: hypothetical protein ACJA00_003391 [Myxococcota bacterium]|jgi:hypothetical protein
MDAVLFGTDVDGLLACTPKTVPRDLIVEPTGQVLSAGRFAVKPANNTSPRYRKGHDETQKAHTSTDC